MDLPPRLQARFAHVQQTELQVLVTRIQKNFEGCAKDLKQIHDGGMYKQEYGTWDNFCRKAIDRTGDTGLRIIKKDKEEYDDVLRRSAVKEEKLKIAPDGEILLDKPAASHNGHKANGVHRGSPRIDFGPGADDDTLGIPYQKQVERDRNHWPDRIDEIADTRQVSKDRAEIVKTMFVEAFKAFSELAAQPLKEMKPFQKKCWHCGQNITIGRTEASNRVMPLETAKGKGGFDIVDDRIVSVDKGPFVAHFPRCIKR